MATFNDTLHPRLDMLIWRDDKNRLIVWMENICTMLPEAVQTIMMLDVQPTEEMEVKEL